ncbi:MAG: GGDEF domain-containing protein, partial [Gammaproteobacteria bacterium]|nr:GGDEF domain-containing protein [Gammaproteobacteria bacterium]
RAFMDAAQMECQRALRRRETLGVLILDIDHFKQFNDRYGHATGDAVLQTVARVLQDNIREIDLIARLGGEEFAAIITHATEDDALIAAERLRLAVARQTFRPSDDSSTPLSISIGAYVGNPAQDTLDLMLVRADQALYDAKRAGRNQTAFYRRDSHLPTSAEPAPDIGL